VPDRIDELLEADELSLDLSSERDGGNRKAEGENGELAKRALAALRR